MYIKITTGSIIISNIYPQYFLQRATTEILLNSDKNRLPAQNISNLPLQPPFIPLSPRRRFTLQLSTIAH